MTRPFKPNDHVVIIACAEGRNVGKQLRLVYKLQAGGWMAEGLEPMYDYAVKRRIPAGHLGLIQERAIRHFRDPDSDETPTEIIKELTA